MNITRGRIPGPKKVLIYGPEGIGKTTFAAGFPDPLFVDTEGSTKELDVARLPEPSSWAILKEEVRYVIMHPDVCRTLVIDTVDWAEKMAIQSVIDEHDKHGIEDFGYGNGYRYVFEKFGELINLLNEVIAAGINVVLTAHATLRKFEQPDEMGAYDRYTMKLIDSPKTSISAMVKEWSDMVLFANYKTIIITDSKTKKTRAQGGQRVMYTSHHSCWDAKNRFGLPEELPFNYDAIRSVIEGGEKQPEPQKTKAPESRPEPLRFSKPEPEPPEVPSKSSHSESEKETTPSSPRDKPAEPVEKTNTHEDLRQEKPVTEEDLDKRIPKALRDLMLLDNISEWDIEGFASDKGFVPFNTKIWDFETVNPGMTEGVFIAQWQKVRDKIIEMRKNQEVPFN